MVTGGATSNAGGSPASGTGSSTASGGTSTDAGGSQATGGVASDAGGSSATGGSAATATYTLVVDTPADLSTVQGVVTVSGQAPGFLNVEVWDSMHTNPPLAQATPDADGAFTTSIDVSTLPSGVTTWTVYAWDSLPGQTFTHTDNVTLNLTIQGVTNPTGGTPDPATAYVPAGYHLAFSDEFSGTTLDTGKWNTLAPWGVQYYSDSHQKQAFIPEAVSVSNGLVTFTAQPSTGNTNGQPYASGSITTNGTFTHGYFEARVRVPAGKGFWPAYWVTSSTRWPPEWDIFEIIDGLIYGYTHPVSGGVCSFVDGAAGNDSTYTINNVYDVFHVYGFNWTATDLYWYVDGVMTEHYVVDAAAGANDPFWLNLSLQVGGDWPGDPDASTPFPSHMDVDYVRVYQP